MSVRLRKWKDRNGKKKEAWWVDVKFQHPDGHIERVRKASPVDTRRGADQYEREVRLALLGGTYGQEESERIPTLKEFVPRFMVYSENNNKLSTVATKRAILERHLVPAFGNTPLDRIRLAELEEFKAAMKKKKSAARGRKGTPTKWAIKKRYGAQPTTLSLKAINNVLAVLRRLLSLAYEQGVMPFMPKVKLFRTEKTTFDFLTFDEAERLLEAVDPEWRTALLVALKTGLRRGEIIGLQWSDLDLVRGKLNVRRTIWAGHSGTPKGGRARVVDMPRSLVEALKAHRHLKGPSVFCGPKGELLTPGQLKWPLTRALRKSGISRPEGRIGWHDLRHTYGSHLAMRGVPVKVIQELMGHASIEMTMRYAHLSPEVKEAAVQVLDQPSPVPMQAAPETPEGHIRGTWGPI